MDAGDIIKIVANAALNNIHCVQDGKTHENTFVLFNCPVRKFWRGGKKRQSCLRGGG